MGVKAKSLRLAMLTPEYARPGAPDGGLANYVRKTARELARRGHDPVVLTIGADDAYREDDGVRVCTARPPPVLSGRIAASPGLASMQAIASVVLPTRRLAQLFWRCHREIPFDLIHASSYGAPAAWLTGNGEVPVVCRLSSHSPTVRAAHGRRSRIEDRVADWLELRQATRSDACFAPSALVAGCYEEATGRPVTVLRTPVETTAAVPDREYFAKHGPTGPFLLFVGTMSRIKGVDVLADALPVVLARHTDLAVVFIGRDDRLPDGTSAFAPIARACGSRAMHLGSLDKPRLQAFLDAAIGVLMPSRVDNYPNVCLEAQAAGVPVIGTRGSSLDEMIEEGVTGFLAENADPSSLGLAIERLLAQSHAERASMRSAILALSENAHRQDRIGQLIELYERTIAEHRGRR